MNKNLQWGVPNTTEISKEVIGSILLQINARTSGDVLASIGNLNKIRFAMSLKRQGQKERVSYDGYLGDFLQILYGGTTKLDVVLTGNADLGYLIRIDFPQPIYVGANDVFTIKTDFGNPSNAFTSATVGTSTVLLMTNPSAGKNTNMLFPVFKSFPVGTGEVDFEKDLGSNISKILIDIHPSETYEATTNPKPEKVELFARGGYYKEQTEVELLSDNEMKLAYNPDSPVKNLVAYDDAVLLNNVKAKIKFDNQAVNHTKVSVMSYIQY